jgi:hypothetical protein
MIDDLDRLEATAVHRLREVLTADPAPALAHPRRLAHRVLAAAAAVLALVGGAVLLTRDDPPAVVADQPHPPGPGPGVKDMVDAYETMEVGWDPTAGRTPPLVMPETLPDDWHYLSGGGSHGPTGGDVRFDFVQESAHIQPLPAVMVCVSLVGGCPPDGEGNWQPVPIAVPGFEGTALLYGEPGVLDQWADVHWMLDPAQAGW